MIGSLVMGTVGFWGSARASLNVAKPSKTQRTSLNILFLLYKIFSVKKNI
jgi:hypothetical protein